MNRHGSVNDENTVVACGDGSIVTTTDNGTPGQAEARDDIRPHGKRDAPDDGHMSPEPWQKWSEDKKLQLKDRITEKIEHFRSEGICKVCLSAEVSRAFKPCGHLSCCAACAKQMKDCPICREPVQGSVVVVLPKPRRKALPMDFELFLQRHDYFGLEKTT